MCKTNQNEGWTWLKNSRKWHYFRENRSLCGKFAIFVKPEKGFEIGGNDSSDNCAKCSRLIKKETADKIVDGFKAHR